MNIYDLQDGVNQSELRYYNFVVKSDKIISPCSLEFSIKILFALRPAISEPARYNPDKLDSKDSVLIFGSSEFWSK
ncbi:MAG: hypothetical protein KAS58_04475 [Calditrichia bacterium]|nr:hypothetical protein [Calditrichia bacterium]